MLTLPTDPAAFDQWRREQFPFFERKIFLTHASVSPLPRASSEAIADYARLLGREGQFDYVHSSIYNRCKERLARLIGHGAQPDEVAFAGSTSHALGLVATGLDWKPGDNCVVADGDFPANVVTWKNLTHTHGVEVRLIPHRPAMDITLDDVRALVDERTRIVSLASANFLSGYPIDLGTIGHWLHQRGVLFCVDAIQTLGAVRLDAKHVDFICADSHKWMLGPNGIALLWARHGALEQLRPAILGWLATKDRDNWYAYDTTPLDSGERFEPGARNHLGVVGFEAALAVLEEAGAEFVEQRVTQLRDYTARRLSEIGCRILWQPDPAKPSGIVSFRREDVAMGDLFKHLDTEFALAMRQDRAGADWIRVSAHFMNTEADIDQLADSTKAFNTN